MCWVGVLWGGVSFYFVWFTVELRNVLLKVKFYLFVFSVGSPTSCCACLGTKLTIMTGSEFPPKILQYFSLYWWSITSTY